MSTKFLEPFEVTGDWWRFKLDVFISYSFLLFDLFESVSLSRPYSIFLGGFRFRGGRGKAEGGAEDCRSFRGGKTIFGSCGKKVFSWEKELWSFLQTFDDPVEWQMLLMSFIFCPMVDETCAKLLLSFCDDRPCFSSRTISSFLPELLELVGVLSRWFLKWLKFWRNVSLLLEVNVAISSDKTAFLPRRLLGKQQIWKQVGGSRINIRFSFKYLKSQIYEQKFTLNFDVCLTFSSFSERTLKHKKGLFKEEKH